MSMRLPGIKALFGPQGRHAQAPRPWPEKIAVIAAVLALLIQPLFPSPLAAHGDKEADSVAGRKKTRATSPAKDGINPYDPDCDDKVVDAAHITPLVAKVGGAVVALLEAAVSRRCDSVFLRLRHVTAWPWHGLVKFVVRRGDSAVEAAVPNLYDPLPAPGFWLPADACVTVSASITRTAFEETEEAFIDCVRRAA